MNAAIHRFGPRLGLSVRHAVPVTVVGVAILALGCRGNDCEPTSPACTIVADMRGPEPALVFSSTRDGPPEIYTMNSDGTNIRRLTNNPGVDIGPRWSPDGAQIVFASRRGSSSSREIFVMNADGSDQRQLTTLGNNAGFADWSPDGTHLAFHAARGDGNLDLYVMNADGSNIRRLTNREAYAWPRWSPDGTKLTFTWAQSAVISNEGGKVGVMNADGTGLRILTKQGMGDVGPDWSPDGRRLVFKTTRATMDGSARGPNVFMLGLVNADGTGETALGGATLGAAGPTWSRSSGRIYFVNVIDGKVYSIRPDGRDLRHVSLDVNYADPHAR